MAKLKSALTWSFSRDRLFRDCCRAYYYHYYASWGGWDQKAPELCRKSYILRNISGIDAWIGDIVHSMIKWILENYVSGKAVDKHSSLDRTKKLLAHTWEQSRSKAWLHDPKNNLNLFEHYYKCEPSREDLGAKLDKAKRSIENLYGSGFIDELSRTSRESFLTIDQLDSFMFEGLQIFAVPDFALRKPEGYILYDWKTGRPSDKDTFQLSFYIMYAAQKWRIDPASVRIVPVYLTQDNVSFAPIAPVDQGKLVEYMRGSITDMKALLIDFGENKIEVERCVKTSETWRCRNCKFQEICS